MNLVEIKMEIPVSRVESVDAILLETESVGWSLLEDVIDRRAWIVGLFASKAEAAAHWQELRVMLPDAETGEPAVREVKDQDWRDSYKAHFKAWQFGRLHWVPVWERDGFVLPEGDEVLWLDPGLAFGTGNHETTRLCVERLVAWTNQHGTSARVIDAGCGSGILALSAAKLGFTRICGFDNDPEAVRVSGENAAANILSGRVEFYAGDLISGLAGRQAELVLANIQADILMRYAQELLAAVAPHGQLVLSGILAVENEQVKRVFTGLAQGWGGSARLMGEWSDLVLERAN